MRVSRSNRLRKYEGPGKCGKTENVNANEKNLSHDITWNRELSPHPASERNSLGEGSAHVESLVAPNTSSSMSAGGPRAAATCTGVNHPGPKTRAI